MEIWDWGPFLEVVSVRHPPECELEKTGTPVWMAKAGQFWPTICFSSRTAASRVPIGCVRQRADGPVPERQHRGITIRPHDTGILGTGTDGFVNGKLATTRVPFFPELISQWPPSCRTLSRMPCMPTPAFSPDEELAGAGRPLPSSWTSTRTSRSSRVTQMRAVGLPE